MIVNDLFWDGRAVLVTGHTGFKGSWLSLWLHELGAKVHGFALDPPTEPSLFEVARIKSLLSSDTRANVADLSRLKSTLKVARPEVIFHLAAQPLVRESYRDPLGTIVTNVLGTANLLEAVRETDSVRVVVVVTTDKVYQIREGEDPYREFDSLGGQDPYSASKAAAEIVTGSYRASFFALGKDYSVRVATARAGNVVGGGDWAADRLVPDCFRAFANSKPVRLRFPNAVRPWQHVLEPLSGYLKLAERLFAPDGTKFSTAWNFGPERDGDATVAEVAETLAGLWGQEARVEYSPSSESPHETGVLRLDSTRARDELEWHPRWLLSKALKSTVAWHQAWCERADMARITVDQIQEFASSAPL